MSPNQSSQALSPENPSSFPGIYKYPANRDKPFRNSYDWLEGKKKDDDIGKLWRVHDKLYDLESFVEKHPGGAHWIRLTQGTDITEAFEASHVVNVTTVEETLKKYFVQNAQSLRISPYTFDPNGFYMTLKRKCAPIFKKVGTNPNRKIVLMQDGLGIAFAVFFFLGVLLNSTIFQILAGLDLAMCVIAGHNFFHLRDNWRKYYFDLSFLSSLEFQISHGLSHHLYTNTVMDIEITYVEPFLKFLPTSDKTLFQRFGGAIYAHVFYAISFFLELIKRFRGILKGEVQLRLENLIIFVELAVALMFAPTFTNGLCSWIFVHMVASYWFMLVGVGGSAHHHPSCFHDGDEARVPADFGLCQLDAIRDRSDDLHQTMFVILTTFGLHSLHHLFPTVCHSKLHHIEGVYEETLKEFGESFPPVSQFELFLGMHVQNANTTPKKLKKDL